MPARSAARAAASTASAAFATAVSSASTVMALAPRLCRNASMPCACMVSARSQQSSRTRASSGTNGCAETGRSSGCSGKSMSNTVS